MDKGKQEEDLYSSVVIVTPEIVMHIISNSYVTNGVFGSFRARCSMPCSHNSLQYGLGENMDTIFEKCSKQFHLMHNLPGQDPRIFKDCLPGRQEVISLTFLWNDPTQIEEDFVSFQNEEEVVIEYEPFSDDDDDVRYGNDSESDEWTDDFDY